MADLQVQDPLPYQLVYDLYVEAVLDAANAVPLIVPAVGRDDNPYEILGAVDGLLLTGSASNVEPHFYGGEPSEAGTLHDPRRDRTVMPLIRKAVAFGIPVFGICRGFQEMNVAFGGSLWQKLHEVPGHDDHRPRRDLPFERQYDIKHEVSLEPGGKLHALADATTALVNTRHAQGVRKLGDGLVVEARSKDGVVEAFRVRNASSFALGVQWHPEWRAAEDPFSRAIFGAFGAACRSGFG